MRHFRQRKKKDKKPLFEVFLASKRNRIFNAFIPESIVSLTQGQIAGKCS